MAVAGKFLNGTTFWINELMSVGHVMYDIVLIQVMQTLKVDRIVLQRAACLNSHLCSGQGMWGSWFKGFYTAVIEAFQPGIPIYVRWRVNEYSLRPEYLSAINKAAPPISNRSLTSSVVDDHGKGNTTTDTPTSSTLNVVLKDTMCFEKVVRRVFLNSFHNGISPSAVQQFKRAAYRLSSKPLLHHIPREGPIVVLLAFRGPKATRRIFNIDDIIASMKRAFTAPKFDFKAQNSSDSSMGYIDQIELVSQAHVIIAEHGAFQSNMIYMRNSSLFVEWRGNYNNPETRNFENLAKIFGVYYAHVVTKGISFHSQDYFNVTNDEAQQAVDIVHQFASQDACKTNSVPLSL